ncbi:hypothetical protein EV182_002053, partial [Spiromyces aspiralis]
MHFPIDLPQHIKDSICVYLELFLAHRELRDLGTLSQSWYHAVQKEKWCYFNFPSTVTTANREFSYHGGYDGEPADSEDERLELFRKEGYLYVQILAISEWHTLDPSLINQHYPCLKEITLPYAYPCPDDLLALMRRNLSVETIHIAGDEDGLWEKEFTYHGSVFGKILSLVAPLNRLTMLNISVTIDMSQVWVVLTNVPTLQTIELSYLIYRHPPDGHGCDGSCDDCGDNEDPHSVQLSSAARNHGSWCIVAKARHDYLRKLDMFTLTIDNGEHLLDVLRMISTARLPGLKHMDLPHFALPDETIEELDKHENGGSRIWSGLDPRLIVSCDPLWPNLGSLRLCEFNPRLAMLVARSCPNIHVLCLLVTASGTNLSSFISTFRLLYRHGFRELQRLIFDDCGGGAKLADIGIFGYSLLFPEEDSGDANAAKEAPHSAIGWRKLSVLDVKCLVLDIDELYGISTRFPELKRLAIQFMHISRPFFPISP